MGQRSPDLSKYLSEYTFALGQAQLNIHKSWNAEAKREENHVDSQAVGIGAKYLMWTTYQRIGNIMKVSRKSRTISKFQKN